jgi:hypothetical protein
MKQLFKMIFNYIINGDSGGVFTEKYGIDEMIENLPFAVPTKEQVNDTVKVIWRRYFPNKDITKVDVMGLMVQQRERPTSGNYFPELEGALKVKVYYAPEDLNGDSCFTVLVYDDAVPGVELPAHNSPCSWQFIGRDYRAPNTEGKK